MKFICNKNLPKDCSYFVYRNGFEELDNNSVVVRGKRGEKRELKIPKKIKLKGCEKMLRKIWDLIGSKKLTKSEVMKKEEILSFLKDGVDLTDIYRFGVENISQKIKALLEKDVIIARENQKGNDRIVREFYLVDTDGDIVNKKEYVFYVFKKILKDFDESDDLNSSYQGVYTGEYNFDKKTISVFSILDELRGEDYFHALDDFFEPN